MGKGAEAIFSEVTRGNAKDSISCKMEKGSRLREF